MRFFFVSGIFELRVPKVWLQFPPPHGAHFFNWTDSVSTHSWLGTGKQACLCSTACFCTSIRGLSARTITPKRAQVQVPPPPLFSFLLGGGGGGHLLSIPQGTTTTSPG